MHTNGICTHCGKKIRFWIALCSECKSIKTNSMAMVSQNKKKLRKILSQRTITAEWFEKFLLYTNNIIKYWKILMDYKEKESMKTFDRIMKFWSISLIILILVIAII